MTLLKLKRDKNFIKYDKNFIAQLVRGMLYLNLRDKF